MPLVLYKVVRVLRPPQYVWAPNDVWSLWLTHLESGRATPFQVEGSDGLGKAVFICSDDVVAIALVLTLPDGG